MLAPVRDVLERSERVADASRLDAFAILWRDLPSSARLVAAADGSAEARRELDAVVALADVVAQAGESADPSVQGFVEALEAGEHGPGYAAAGPGTKGRVPMLPPSARGGAAIGEGLV